MTVDVDEVLRRIESGESQAEIARALNVDAGDLSRLLSKDEEISQRSARARSISAEAWLDRGFDYVLDEKNDPSRARIIAQECARRAALRNPAYRESNKTEITGANGGPVQFQKIERLIVDSV